MRNGPKSACYLHAIPLDHLVLGHISALLGPVWLGGIDASPGLAEHFSLGLLLSWLRGAAAVWSLSQTTSVVRARLSI